MIWRSFDSCKFHISLDKSHGSPNFDSLCSYQRTFLKKPRIIQHFRTCWCKFQIKIYFCRCIFCIFTSYLLTSITGIACFLAIFAHVTFISCVSAVPTPAWTINIVIRTRWTLWKKKRNEPLIAVKSFQKSAKLFSRFVFKTRNNFLNSFICQAEVVLVLGCSSSQISGWWF